MTDTTHKRILELLSDGNWHHSNEICSPMIGGRQGGARICEIRANKDRYGLTPEEDIEDRWVGGVKKYKEYRLVKKAEQSKLFNLKPKYYL